MIPNYLLKLKAREALKNNWQTALMVGLIASLPSLISQVVQILSQNSAAQNLEALLASGSQVTLAELAAGMHFSWGSILPVALINLLAAVVSPALRLGWLNYTLRLLRGEQELDVNTVFSRMNCFFKALGLALMAGLRTVLWSLLGVVLMLPGAYASVALGEGNILGTLLLWAGMAASFWLILRAVLRYYMAFHFMAEDPQTGINQAIRLSIGMMEGRKMALFSLELSFLLYNLGITLLEMLLMGMLGSVLSSTVSMVLNFVVSVYMQTAVGAFYLAYRQESTI